MLKIENTVLSISGQSEDSRRAAKARLDQLTMPHWALGSLMDLAVDLAGISESTKPEFNKRAVVVMAGDHGVAAEGVSKYPQEVTVQMVANFVHGGAGINALAKCAKADVIVVDMGVAGDLSEVMDTVSIRCHGVARGTQNMACGPAMTRDQARIALETGISIARELASNYQILGCGEMGIANTTAAAAIICALSGKSAAKVAGRGTGLDDLQLNHKVEIIEKALSINNPDASDPVDILSKVGGFEIGGLTGMMLGAAACGIPVLVDGFISTSAALLAKAICPMAAEFMIASHLSEEAGHRIALEHLEKSPLLDLSFRLGEGTGSAMALHLVDAAVSVLTNVATFAEAQVSGADK